MSDVTQILQSVEQGENFAERLLPLVYEELRKLAAVKMFNEAAGHTLQPTALVHEAWLRLAGKDADAPFANRAHFFAAAAEAMRRILIDSARRREAQKRGAGLHHVNLDDVDVAAKADGTTLLRVDEALAKLGQEDPPAAELVKLRFFGGLTNEQAAAALGISVRTAKRHWAFARACSTTTCGFHPAGNSTRLKKFGPVRPFCDDKSALNERRPSQKWGGVYERETKLFAEPFQRGGRDQRRHRTGCLSPTRLRR